MARILGRIALVIGLALAVLVVYGVGRIRSLRSETVSRDVELHLRARRERRRASDL